jgi:hypothetical protein
MLSRRVGPGAAGRAIRIVLPVGLGLRPGLGAFGTTIRAAQGLAGQRTIRIDAHHQDHGSAPGQTGHGQNVADKLADADTLAVVPKHALSSLKRPLGPLATFVTDV